MNEVQESYMALYNNFGTYLIANNIWIFLQYGDEYLII
jgi:hypothetical protein